MTTNRKQTGACLCRSIQVHINSYKEELGACHCSMCRSWGAGPFMGFECGSDVQIDGKEHLGLFQSSEWAERGFCKNCGSNLFYRLKESNLHIVSSEIFKGLDLKFDHEIFIDEKPSYYEFAGELKKMTGAEVFASFSGENTEGH